MMMSLKKQKATKVWNIGCLKKRIKEGLVEWAINHQEYSQQNINDAGLVIEQKIVDAVTYLNHLKRKAQLVVRMWI